MFNPKTKEVEQYAATHKNTIEQLEGIFDRPTNLYIDYANIRKRSGWLISLQRVKDILDSFSHIQIAKFFYGVIPGPEGSKGFHRYLKRLGFEVTTKPVKTIRLPIDVTSISPQSPDILSNLIDPCLLKKLNLATVEYLNEQLRDLNKQGIKYLEKPKCNFDVEIGVEMRLDHINKKCQGFCLWSGDSDFADPVRTLLSNKSKVTIFGIAGRISSEMNELRDQGLGIFDFNKLRDLAEQTKAETAERKKAKEKLKKRP